MKKHLGRIKDVTLAAILVALPLLIALAIAAPARKVLAGIGFNA